MIIVTEQEAIEYISNNKLVLVVWVRDTCPDCGYFSGMLSELEKEYTDWKFLQVSIDSKLKLLGWDTEYFEPSVYPSVFIFKDSRRVSVAHGFAPKATVSAFMDKVLIHNYKSPQEIEKELLDALD